jgi:spore coat protein CotH
VEEEITPVYGSKRFEIVDEVLGKMQQKELLDAISPVQ